MGEDCSFIENLGGFNIDNKNIGLENNLLAQLDKLVRHNRQGSFKTRKRYTEAMKQFCFFLANIYRLQKLTNIKEKHIEAYVVYMKEKGLATSTIKTNLSGIRFWYDQIPATRNSLPDNSQLALKRRNFREKERAWTHNEFNKMLCVCLEQNKADYIAIFSLARYAGLRIHECFRIDTAIASNAIKTDLITIKGKEGLIRSIPINKIIEIHLQQMLDKTSRGHKLFVSDDVPTHEAINKLQQFIILHRGKIQSPNDSHKLTFHGLRHLYACEKYMEFKGKGFNDIDSRKKVSKLLGHNRDDVTRIYLTSLNRLNGFDMK